MQETGNQDLQSQVNTLNWYHSIDLGGGLITPGHYDHRPYLHNYGIPADLTGKTVLDIGTASGFFAFEMEKRGAQVTATDLPAWKAHDFGPNYQYDQTDEQGLTYLREPFAFAKKILGSRVEKREINIYDITPDTIGRHDIVFCASVLLHLTDPEKALWRIQSVTKEYAILATQIYDDANPYPFALFTGKHEGVVWWSPNRACLEAMITAAGFKGWQWASEFRLDFRNGTPGAYHGVIKAYNQLPPGFVQEASRARPAPEMRPVDETLQIRRELETCQQEIARLQEEVEAYRQRKIIRLVDEIAGLFRH